MSRQIKFSPKPIFLKKKGRENVRGARHILLPPVSDIATTEGDAIAWLSLGAQTKLDPVTWTRKI
jgi:hypothetical protein